MAIEIVDFPIKNGGSFHSETMLNIYQRVNLHFPMVFHGFPIKTAIFQPDMVAITNEHHQQVASSTPHCTMRMGNAGRPTSGTSGWSESGKTSTHIHTIILIQYIHMYIIYM